MKKKVNKKISVSYPSKKVQKKLIESCDCEECKSLFCQGDTVVELDDRLIAISSSTNTITSTLSWPEATFNVDFVYFNGVKYVRYQSIGARIAEWFFKYIIDKRCFE